MTKKMKSISNRLLMTALLGLAAGCSSSPKVLVDHSFRGKSKTSKVMLERTGAKADGKELYNAYVRLCDLKEHKEVSCQDTMVLPNVVADSIY